MRSCGSKRSQDSKERKNQKKGDKVTARFKQLRKNIYSGSLFFNHQIKREGLIKCARYQTASGFRELPAIPSSSQQDEGKTCK